MFHINGKDEELKVQYYVQIYQLKLQKVKEPFVCIRS